MVVSQEFAPAVNAGQGVKLRRVEILRELASAARGML